jgi:hypothetical protein
MNKNNLCLVATISQNFHPQIWVLGMCYILYSNCVSLRVLFTANVLPNEINTVEGTALPIQALTDSEGSRRLILPDLKTFST